MTHPQTGTTFGDADFRRIVAIAASEAGLAIPEAKRSLVQSRVARRMRALGLQDCGDYLKALDKDSSETQNLIAVLTTNVSNFYREQHHFNFVRDTFLTGAVPPKLRFWSAGCSNGQEPYTLAIEILKAVPDAGKRDILVLATDIDGTVLEKAAKGVYTEAEIEGVLQADRDRFFKRTPTNEFEVCEALRALVRFRMLNLNGPSWPMQGPFDAIFCRNVVIYFSDETQARLWPRFHGLLKPGGILMLGHSERLHPVEGSGFETAGVTTYRKTTKAGPT